MPDSTDPVPAVPPGFTLVPDAKLAELALTGARLEMLRNGVVCAWHDGRILHTALHVALGMTEAEFAAWESLPPDLSPKPAERPRGSGIHIPEGVCTHTKGDRHTVAPYGDGSHGWCVLCGDDTFPFRDESAPPTLAGLASLVRVLDAAAEVLVAPEIRNQLGNGGPVDALLRAVSDAQAVAGSPTFHTGGYVDRTGRAVLHRDHVLTWPAPPAELSRSVHVSPEGLRVLNETFHQSLDKMLEARDGPRMPMLDQSRGRNVCPVYGGPCSCPCATDPMAQPQSVCPVRVEPKGKSGERRAAAIAEYRAQGPDGLDDPSEG